MIIFIKMQDKVSFCIDYDIKDVYCACGQNKM